MVQLQSKAIVVSLSLRHYL